MKTKKILLMALALMLMILMPVAVADHATNEAILGLTLEFEGEGNSTTITVTIVVNSVAENDNSLVTNIYVNDKSDANKLGSTNPGTFTFSTLWDIDEYAEGYHTLIVEFSNPTESTHDNKADNEMELMFTTQDYAFALLVDGYAYVQYHIGRVARTSLDGYLSILAEYPLWIWLLGVGAIIVLIVVVLRGRKFNKPYREHYKKKKREVKNRVKQSLYRP